MKLATPLFTDRLVPRMITVADAVARYLARMRDPEAHRFLESGLVGPPADQAPCDS